MKEYLHRLNQSKTRLYGTGIVLTFIVGFFDYLTGQEIGVAVFYLIPIGYMTLFSPGTAPGYMFSLLSCGAMILSDYFAGKAFTNYLVDLWNLLVHLLFFIIFVFLLRKLKFEFFERERLIRELRDAMKEIKTLSGLLPMCAWCKKIRDDRGYWKQVETYISEHTKAEFSHGICPECARKVYPGLFDKEKDK